MADLLGSLKDLDKWVTDWLAQIHTDIDDDEKARLADDMACDWFGSGMGASFQMQIEETEKAAQADAWQPIVTAPKDGSTIVACRDEKGHRAPTLIFWCDQDGWCGLTANDEKRIARFQPTHWLVAVPALQTVSEASHV